MEEMGLPAQPLPMLWTRPRPISPRAVTGCCPMNWLSAGDALSTHQPTLALSGQTP